MLVIVGSVRTVVLTEVQSLGSVQLFEFDSCDMRAGGEAALRQR